MHPSPLAQRKGIHQAPTIAKTMKESDGTSESCPVAELKAMIKTVAEIEIQRGMSEEMAGKRYNHRYDRERAIELEPTILTSTMDLDQIKMPISPSDDSLPPTTVIQDNRNEV